MRLQQKQFTKENPVGEGLHKGKAHTLMSVYALRGRRFPAVSEKKFTVTVATAKESECWLFAPS